MIFFLFSLPKKIGYQEIGLFIAIRLFVILRKFAFVITFRADRIAMV